jgi:MFS family permease
MLTRGQRRLLAVLCGVIFLDGLDISLVGVALPSIRADLGLTNEDLQWVVSAYVLGYGGFLLLGGRTSDMLGRRRILLAALGVFAVASLLGGLVSDPTLLLVTPFLKGAAAAFTAPAGLAIVITSFAEGHARNRALSIYAATGASGFSLGLVVGGVMTQLGWRWAFILPAPLAVGLLWAGLRVVPRDPPPALDRRFDAPGAVTLTVGMLLLVRTVVEAPSAGWGSSSTLVGSAGSLMLLALFVGIERRSRAPLLRLTILRSRAVLYANLGAMALFGAYIGFQFVLTLYLQTLNHWSPIRTALAFLPLGLLITVGATRSGPLISRLGTRRLIALGFVSLTIGYLLATRIGRMPAYGVVILPAAVLIGLGIGVAFPSLNLQATAEIPHREQGLAAALIQSSLQFGGAVTLAIVTAVVTSNAGARGHRGAALGAYRDGLFVVAGVAAAGLLLAMLRLIRHTDKEAIAA